MKKLANELRKDSLEELDEKEKELRIQIMSKECELRGGGTNRMGYIKQGIKEKNPSLKKLKKALTVLLTIRRENQRR